MKELISPGQANILMWAMLVIAPAIGTLLGASVKRARVGLVWGVVVGIGNLILWNVYNAITDRLGMDTVKNLIVNLCLFLGIGLIGGIIAALMAQRSRHSGEGNLG